MSKHRVLSFQARLRLEGRGQDGQSETEQPDHSASLGDSITSSTRIRFSVHTGLVPDAHGAQSAPDDAAIDPVAIADEVVRSLIPGKCLRDLTCNPFGRRICCDADPDEVPAVEPDDDEGIEEVETDRWNNEQVHGGNVRRMVAQEGPPS